MKQAKHFFRYMVLTVVLLFLLYNVLEAQDSALQVNTETATNWFENNWKWVVGGIVVILLIAGLAGGRRRNRRVTTTVIKDDMGKYCKRVLPEQ